MKTKIITTPIGKIECWYQLGEGTPILFIHGTPGDAQQVKFYLDDYISAGHSVISITRPGYGHATYNPLSETFIRQSECINAVLDALNIDKVIMYAVSGGAGVAYKYLSQHHDKCLGLILESPVMGAWKPNNKTILDALIQLMYQNIYAYKFGKWLFTHCMSLCIFLTLKYFGKYSIKEACTITGEVMDNPLLINRYSNTFFDNYNPLNMGYKIDVEELSEDIHYLPICNLPILVIHGERDREIPIEAIRSLVVKFNNINFYEVKQGNHLLPLNSSRGEVASKRDKFITSVLAKYINSPYTR